MECFNDGERGEKLVLFHIQPYNWNKFPTTFYGSDLKHSSLWKFWFGSSNNSLDKQNHRVHACLEIPLMC